jgi:hypothetical protein
MPLACSVCLLARGFRDSEGGTLPRTQEELNEHMECVHHWIIQREGETLEEAAARVRAKVGSCAECDTARATNPR